LPAGIDANARRLQEMPPHDRLSLIHSLKGHLVMAYPVDNLPPIHPGSFLRDELEALGMSARKFANHIHVPHNAVTGIMNGDRSISAEMAIRLGQAFGTTPQYWMNLQAI
jgi:addiction module HigA family antidote